jgi:hypothetical protein
VGRRILSSAQLCPRFEARRVLGPVDRDSQIRSPTLSSRIVEVEGADAEQRVC